MARGGQGRPRRGDQRIADQARSAAGQADKKKVVELAGGDCRPAERGQPPARRGFAFSLWRERGDGELDQAFREMAALGATEVALVVSWRQESVASVTLAPGPATPADAVVVRAIARARRNGLRVLLFPIVLLDQVSPGKWRGTLAPVDRDAWWGAYERFILHYAAIAEREGALALSIGSELGTTETWRDRWFHLISRIERVYDGELTYSANWDHYQQVSFADRLDFVGVTGYFQLTKRSDASQAELIAAWHEPALQLVAWSRRLAKPLVLTEVGVPSVDGGAVRPWDYLGKGKVDFEEQRRSFAALASAWSRLPLAGVFVWEWEGGERGYAVRGKPAACELWRWFAATDE